jgi:Rps23 Pro-64 3,4-dihydroxylase Tpa1-like proline 4-hydroxylase
VIDELLIAPERLERLGRRLAPVYAAAQPFPHIVMDDFLPAAAAEEILRQFPARQDEIWNRNYHSNSKKLAQSDLSVMPEGIRECLLYLNSAPFLQFLERLTGVPDLLADPDFWGGGMHLIRRGGFLKVHADFNVHAAHPEWDRRLNLLLYLNPEWKPEYGGHLELWDRDMSRCVQSIAPVFNRCVVFSTTDFSYHGHPDPLRCPGAASRKSLATYYYTHGRPAEEATAAHHTLYQRRPPGPFSHAVREALHDASFRAERLLLRWGRRIRGGRRG